jgi:hypothetical protein
MKTPSPVKSVLVRVVSFLHSRGFGFVVYDTCCVDWRVFFLVVQGLFRSRGRSKVMDVGGVVEKADDVVACGDGGHGTVAESTILTTTASATGKEFHYKEEEEQEDNSNLLEEVPGEREDGSCYTDTAMSSRKSVVPVYRHHDSLEPLFCDEHEISEYIAMYVDGVLSDEQKKHENWKERVEAMVVLERLVLGGAGEMPLFVQEMNACHHILDNQLMDRRSAVSKQACVLVGTLMERCGYAVKSLALALQPSLLKLHGLSIAVMAQSAQDCLSFVYEYCHDGRLLSHLCSVICTDRNTKLRYGASCQLLRVIECWEQYVVDQYRVDVEQTMICAFMDASSDTRVVGRQMFEAYCVRYEEQARLFVGGLKQHHKDGKMVEKFSAILRDQKNYNRDVDVVVPSVKATVTVVEDVPADVLSSMGSLGGTAKKKMGAGPQRIPQTVEKDGGARNAARKSFGKKRQSLGGALRVTSSASSGVPAAFSEHDVGGTTTTDVTVAEDIPSLVRYLYTTHGLVWSDKISCLKRLEDGLGSVDEDMAWSGDVVDMLGDALVSDIGDAHYKVSSQAMMTFCAACRNVHVATVLQNHMESFIPVLFVKIGDTKELVRHGASEALSVIKETINLDLVLQGLVGATRTCKSTRSQCAIMMYFEEIFVLHKGGSGNAWRTMLAFCLRMATNKNPEVREQAVAACSRVYYSGKQSAVEAALSGLPTSPRAAIKKALDDCPPPTEAVSSLSDAFALHAGEDDDEEELTSGVSEEEASISMMEEDVPCVVSFGEVCSPEYESALHELEAARLEGDSASSAEVDTMWQRVSSVLSAPSKDLFRLLNEIDAQSVVSLTESERETFGAALWEGFVSVVLAPTPDEEIACAACSSIVSYFNFIPQDMIEAKIDAVIESLLKLADAPDYELATMAVAAGIQLVKAADPADAYSCIAPMLPDPTKLPPFQGTEARRACHVLKFLRPCLRRVPQAQLRAALDLSMPALCKCFESPNAEIRHLCMDCIVSIQKTVGPEHTLTFTQSMTKTQQKLIEIQFQKQ